jgi:hypothetical protein
VPAGYPSDGTYRIVPGGMTLNAPADYLLVFEEGQLVIPDHFTYYADADGDGFGLSSDTVVTCDSLAPSGYTAVAGDCNDSNASINPSASEICNNGVDDDCDGQTDENCLPTCTLAAISGPAALCNPNAQVIVYSVPPAVGASSYTWSVPAGTTILSGQGTSSISVSWPYSVIHSGLTGSVCVVANFGDTCVSAPSCMSISVQASTPVTPPYISGPPRACPGEEATYSIANVSRATSYVWTPPSGVTLLSGQGSNVITVRFESGFTGGSMAVSGVNQCGVSPQRTKTLSLNILSAPSSIAGFRNGVCGMSGVVYSIPAVNGATSYLWTVPAGASLIGAANGTSVVVDFSGNFSSGSISVKALNLCGSGATRTVTVVGRPVVAGPISGPVSVCTGSSIQYSIPTVNGASSYTWTAPIGAVVSSGQGTKSITVTYGATPFTGLRVNVSAANACGSSNLNLFNVVATNCPRFGNSNSNSLHAYPNPFTDRVQVQFDADVESESNLRLINMIGEIVISRTLQLQSGTQLIELDAGTIPSGTYLLELESNQQVYRTTLVKF